MALIKRNMILHAYISPQNILYKIGEICQSKRGFIMKKLSSKLSLLVLPILIILSVSGCGGPQITEISIQSEESKILDINETDTISYSVKEEGANTDNLQFISTNESVATFTKNSNQDASLQTISEGTTNIYIQTEDGKVISNQIAITVEDKERIAQMKSEAEQISKAIAAIGTVSFDEQSKKKIESARQMYDDASDEVKQLVSNESLLIQAEESYQNQESIAKEAEKVTKVIDEIGTVSYNDQSKAKIETARKSYDNATDEVKKLVTNVDKLTAAEQTYQNQKTASEKANTSKLNNSTSTNQTSAQNGRTVYVTRTGKKYHYANPCGRGKYIATNLQEAINRGFSPCEKCVL